MGSVGAVYEGSFRLVHWSTDLLAHHKRAHLYDFYKVSCCLSMVFDKIRLDTNSLYSDFVLQYQIVLYEYKYWRTQ